MHGLLILLFTILIGLATAQNDTTSEQKESTFEIGIVPAIILVCIFSCCCCVSSLFCCLKFKSWFLKRREDGIHEQYFVPETYHQVYQNPYYPAQNYYIPSTGYQVPVPVPVDQNTTSHMHSTYPVPSAPLDVIQKV